MLLENKKIFKLFVIGSVIVVGVLNSLTFTKYFVKVANENKHESERVLVDNWNATKSLNEVTDLRILVLTFNRPKSLARLLISLNEAEYLNDNVILEIWIDRNKNQEFDRETFFEASSFNFSNGQKFVYIHNRSVGLIGQWIYTWRPRPSCKEIAVFLEDDLTVSIFFYRYLKLVHVKYEKTAYINGFSLHVLREKAGFEKPTKTGIQDIVLLYPILDSWGFSPKRDHWIAFIKWYERFSVNKTFQPFVPGLVQTQWYKKFLKQGRADSMWTMWHIYYSWQKKHFTLYPNFNLSKGLSKNWKEPGLHFAKGRHIHDDSLVDNWDEDQIKNRFPISPVKIKY